LHTWGSALTHHPHVHMIVPGGGLSPGGRRWIACRPGFLLPRFVNVGRHRRMATVVPWPTSKNLQGICRSLRSGRRRALGRAQD